MATLEYKTAITRKVLSEVNLDINDGNVHKYADYTGFVKPRLNAIYDIISKIALLLLTSIIITSAKVLLIETKVMIK